jgi:signal peptidase II
MKPLWRALAIAAAIIALDHATKWWILLSLMQPPSVIEVTPFLNIVLTWNRGVSFGMFNTDSTVGPWILSVLAVAVVIGLAVWLAKGVRPVVEAGLALIIGGALGNVIDRVIHGAVVDFLDVHAGGYHWPAFNVADSAITIGAALLILDSLFAGRSGQAKMPGSQ